MRTLYANQQIIYIHTYILLYMCIVFNTRSQSFTVFVCIRQLNIISTYKCSKKLPQNAGITHTTRTAMRSYSATAKAHKCCSWCVYTECVCSIISPLLKHTHTQTTVHAIYKDEPLGASIAPKHQKSPKSDRSTLDLFQTVDRPKDVMFTSPDRFTWDFFSLKSTF